MADPFWLKFCTPLAQRILSMITDPAAAATADAPYILEETIDDVLADGRYVIGGDTLTTKGTAKLRKGQRVHVFWRRGRRERILTHQWQRAQGGLPATPYNNIEELYFRYEGLGPDGRLTATTKISLWFRNGEFTQQLLDVTTAPWMVPIVGGTIEERHLAVKWGADGASFVVRQYMLRVAFPNDIDGQKAYHVYALARGGRSEPITAGITATFIRTERPYLTDLLLSTVVQTITATKTERSVTPKFSIAYEVTRNEEGGIIAYALTGASYDGLETHDNTQSVSDSQTWPITMRQCVDFDFYLSKEREVHVLTQSVVHGAFDIWFLTYGFGVPRGQYWNLWLVNTTKGRLVWGADKPGLYGGTVGPGTVECTRTATFPPGGEDWWFLIASDLATTGGYQPVHRAEVPPGETRPLIVHGDDTSADTFGAVSFYGVLDGLGLPFINQSLNYTLPGGTATIGGFPIASTTLQPISGPPDVPHGVVEFFWTHLLARSPQPSPVAQYRLLGAGDPLSRYLLDVDRLFLPVWSRGPDTMTVGKGGFPLETERWGVFIIEPATNHLVATLKPWTVLEAAVGHTFRDQEAFFLSGTRTHCLWGDRISGFDLPTRTTFHLSNVETGIDQIVAVVESDAESRYAVAEVLLVILPDVFYQYAAGQGAARTELGAARTPDAERFIAAWNAAGQPTLTFTLTFDPARGWLVSGLSPDGRWAGKGLLAPGTGGPPTTAIGAMAFHALEK